MDADPIVLMALTDFKLAGRQVREGDTVVIRPGRSVSLVHDLPLDYGPIMGADLAGQLKILTPNRPQLVELASAVGLEPPSPAPRTPRRQRPFRRRASLSVIR